MTNGMGKIRNSVRAIFLIAALAGATPCQAQKKTFRQELTLGPSFGVSLSSVSFSPRVPTQMKMGFNGGVTARWITERNLGL